MKKLISFMVLAGCILFSINANAGDGPTTSLKAEKVCTPALDVFNLDNVESLLGVGDKKVTSFEMVLALPGYIYKYSSPNNGDFKTIMSKIKEHAACGALLFVDEVKTTDGKSIPNATFNLLLSFDDNDKH